MSIKPDHWIKRMASERGMIEPFESSQVRSGVISYGVSSYGYDIRVADEFKIFTNVINKHGNVNSAAYIALLCFICAYASQFR